MLAKVLLQIALQGRKVVYRRRIRRKCKWRERQTVKTGSLSDRVFRWRSHFWLEAMEVSSVYLDLLRSPKSPKWFGVDLSGAKATLL